MKSENHEGNFRKALRLNALRHFPATQANRQPDSEPLPRYPHRIATLRTDDFWKAGTVLFRRPIRCGEPGVRIGASDLQKASETLHECRGSDRCPHRLRWPPRWWR